MPNNREWNPLLYIGGIHLRSLVSWIQSKVHREVHVKSYRELEEENTLFLMLEARDPKTHYYDWTKITPSDTRSCVIYPLRDATFDEYVKMVDSEFPKAMKEIQWQWASMTKDLRNKDPYSPLNFIIANRRAPWYITLGNFW